MPSFAYDHSITPPPDIIAGFFVPPEKWTTGERVDAGDGEWGTRLKYVSDNGSGGINIHTPGVPVDTRVYFTGEYRTTGPRQIDLGGFLGTAAIQPSGNVWTTHHGDGNWHPFICAAKAQDGNTGMWVTLRGGGVVDGMTVDLRRITATTENPARSMVLGGTPAPLVAPAVGLARVGRAYLGDAPLFGATPAPPPAPSVPTTTFWNDCEAGVAGQFVVPGAQGSGSPWTTVSPNIVKYGPGIHGAVGVAVEAGNSTGLLQWNNPTPASKAAVGFWLKPGAIPTPADARLCDLRQNSTGGTVGGILLTTQARFRVMVASSGLPTGQSPIFPMGVPYWVSLGWDCDAKTAQITVHDAAGTLLHDSGLVAVTSTYTELTTARFVRPVSFDIGDSIYDDFQFNLGSAAPLPPWIPVPADLPPSSGKPTAANTGHDGTTLTPASGVVNLDTGGVVYENMDLAGRIQVRATTGGPITIRNCRIRGVSGGTSLIDCGRAGIVQTIIENCTLIPDAPSNDLNGIVGHDFTARRNNISRCVDSFGAWNQTNNGGPLNVVIEENYSHHLHVQSPDPNQPTDNRTHNDHVQIHTGGGIVIRGNNFEGAPSPTSIPGGLPIFSNVMLNGSRTQNADITIEDNWLQGGTGMLNGGDPNPGPKTVYCRRNIFDNIDNGQRIITRAGDTWVIEDNVDTAGNPVTGA
jgi:hypothetical protein